MINTETQPLIGAVNVAGFAVDVSSKELPPQYPDDQHYRLTITHPH